MAPEQLYMYTLRCTRRLLGRIPAGGGPAEGGETTTLLGDWYANLLNVGRLRLVLCTSERSLLTVLVPSKNLAAFHERLTVAVTAMLADLGISPAAIERERRAMNVHQIAPTASRRVLGSMNDFAYLADVYIRDDGRDVDLLTISRQLSAAPCSPIGMESPDRLTRQLFVRAT